MTPLQNITNHTTVIGSVHYASGRTVDVYLSDGQIYRLRKSLSSDRFPTAGLEIGVKASLLSALLSKSSPYSTIVITKVS